jgi:hypothetical protein
LDLTDDINEILIRTQAINSTVEGNFLKDTTAFDIISEEVIAGLCWQVTEN